MSEIEKMYRCCKIKKQQTCRSSDTCHSGSLNRCEGCNSYQFPPFTPEKQLELIKWLAKYDISIWHTKVWDIEADELSGCISGEVFENVLAQYINYIWQDLTEQERKQIKEILE